MFLISFQAVGVLKTVLLKKLQEAMGHLEEEYLQLRLNHFLMKLRMLAEII